MRKSSIQIYSISQYSLFYKPITSDCYLRVVITDRPKDLIYGEEYLQIQQCEKREDQINQYINTIQFVEERLTSNSIQINQTQNGISEALLCALLMYKGFSLKLSKLALQIMDIKMPPEEYLPSLQELESFLMTNSELLSSSNLIQPEFTVSYEMSVPVFNCRLIENQIFPNILESGVQVESVPLID